MTVWDLYFSTLVGWSLHPGYQKEGSKPPLTIGEAALLADRMMTFHNHRRMTEKEET